MENEFFCGGNCSECEKFTKEAPTLTESEVGVPTAKRVGKEQKEAEEKARSKESEDEEKLDKLIKELEKKSKEEQEKYKKKK